MSKIDEVGSFGAPLSYRVSGLDTLRIKAFNSWPQTEQVERLTRYGLLLVQKTSNSSSL